MNFFVLVFIYFFVNIEEFLRSLFVFKSLITNLNFVGFSKI